MIKANFLFCPFTCGRFLTFLDAFLFLFTLTLFRMTLNAATTHPNKNINEPFASVWAELTNMLAKTVLAYALKKLI